MKTNFVKEWDRLHCDGIYQLVAETYDGDFIETGRDVTEMKCKELYDAITEENPNLDNYKDFCRAYRDGKKEFDDYAERDERRYKKFWNE